TEDRGELSGGLSRHSIGMIFGSVGLIIAAAVGIAFFEWSFKFVGAIALFWVLFGWWGYASEQADKRARRLVRMERKINQVLEGIGTGNANLQETRDQLSNISKRLDRMEHEQGVLHEHLQELNPK
ncbi:MAG TPA: hypothetical protein VFU86_05175, partial [Terriglobales bacterium]|nr:hypothetical protein [Terriglobales bacterium]